MAQFTITEGADPFLHVSLQQGEKIYCESNSMVMMEDTLDIVLTLSIPTSRFVGVDLVLTDDEAQEYEEILIKRKQVEQRTSLVN